MGRIGKLKRFEEIEERSNVVEPSKGNYDSIKGKWNVDFFKNNNPITLELTCGSGEYTNGLAELFPNRNHIGIDIKGERIWKGSSEALEKGLTNVGFLRIHLLELANFFEKDEVNEIWITFPDPRPRERDAKRRVTHQRFIDIYKSIVADDSWIRLKTDNTELFEYTLEELQSRNDIKDLNFTADLYYSEFITECHNIRTHYENKFSAQGHDIKYLKFKFSN
jgi:tRNA (guanine-N7-)-methyltransferase